MTGFDFGFTAATRRGRSAFGSNILFMAIDKVLIVSIQRGMMAFVANVTVVKRTNFDLINITL